MKYAADTSVDVARTSAELEGMLLKEGAERFTRSNDETRHMAMVAFRMNKHSILFELKLPNRKDPRFWEYKLGKQTKMRTESVAYKMWEQECRSQWRALYAVIKAKLISIASGVESFEDAFLANICVNDSGKAKRFGELAVKAIHESYVKGGLPALMSGMP